MFSLEKFGSINTGIELFHFLIGKTSNRHPTERLPLFFPVPLLASGGGADNLTLPPEL